MRPEWHRWTFRNLFLYCEVGRLGSLREVARVHRIDASQVSRLVSSMEAEFGTRLVERSVEGVRFSQRGLEVKAQFERVLQTANRQFNEVAPAVPALAIAATAYLNTRVVAPAIGRIRGLDPSPSFRLIDFSPDDLVAHGLQGAFEIAVHVGQLQWPRTWITSNLGHVQWQLFCRRGHPLTRRKRLLGADVAEYPFVQPVYWTRGGLDFGNDHCPLPRDKRKNGHSTSTADAAVAIVRSTDELAFLPEVLCREEVQRRALTKLDVEDWPEVDKPLMASFRTDAVTVKVLETVTAALRAVTSG